MTLPIVVAASGYFDPLHVGHLEYLERSRALGDRLVVIVNNDDQARLKKGAPFMPCAERVKIVQALKCVDLAVASIDQDRTVCQTLAQLHPTIFTNGGDQNNESIPEAVVCAQLGIRLTDGLGDKIQSSSWLVAGLIASHPPLPPSDLFGPDNLEYQQTPSESPYRAPSHHPGPLPPRAICSFFARGRCARGDGCAFSHSRK